MKFATPLIAARLIRRYKRFLADVELETGETLTAHVANSGAMTGLSAPGSRIWLSRSDDPKRKLSHSWELVEVMEAGIRRLVGVNTAHPNRLAEEAILAGTIAELSGYARLRREVRYGVNSRIDLLLESPDRPPCFVEVKSVTLFRQPGLAEFPDAVTARGAKHLEEMAREVANGARAVMLYLVQAEGLQRFTVAGDIDPAYARALAKARAAGVECLAYGCRVSPQELRLDQPLALSF